MAASGPQEGGKCKRAIKTQQSQRLRQQHQQQQQQQQMAVEIQTGGGSSPQLTLGPMRAAANGP